MRKCLTAQEALEKFGFVVHLTSIPVKSGDVVENNDPLCKIMPVGTKLLIIGHIGYEEARKVVIECGWSTHTMPGCYTYKAIAE